MSDLYREPIVGNPVESAVVRIWNTGKKMVVGAGFLITDHQVLTCAHVVQAALGRPDAITPPSEMEPVTLDFPLIEDTRTQTACVVAWRPKPTEATPDGLDFALLRLAEDPPMAARPIPLAEDTDLWEHSFRALGFPKGYDVGVWARGVVLGSMAGQRVQIVADKIGHTVAPGFSGGPVWDSLAGGVVGIVVVSDAQSENRAAGMIPSRILLEACPELRAMVATPLALQPAGGPFDPDWYIERTEEKEALAHLHYPGHPAVIWGPHSAGKSWLFQHLIRQLHKEPGGPRYIIEIDLARYDPDIRNSLDNLLHEIANDIVDQMRIAGNPVTEVWNPAYPLGPKKRLERFLEKHVFPQIQGQLVLAIERTDAIWGYGAQDGFFSLLRNWVDMATSMATLEPWSRLRLMLAVSTTPTRLSQGRKASPFNIVKPVDLRDLDKEHVRKLVQLYRLEISAQDFNELMEQTRGHPNLVRVALFEAAINQRSLSSVLQETGSNSAFGWHLQNLRNWLEDQADLRDALCAALKDPFKKLPARVEDELERAGLLKWSDGQYYIRYPLYESYFRSRLCP